MVLTKLSLILVCVSLVLYVEADKSDDAYRGLLNLLKKAVEENKRMEGIGSGTEMKLYPMEYNFYGKPDLPFAYCKIKDGEIDIIKDMNSAPFEKVIGDQCLSCSGCQFSSGASSGMVCKKLSKLMCGGK